MSLFDVATIAVAAFLNGWFISSLVKLDAEGDRWPQIRRFLLRGVQITILTQGCLSVSWWLNYHHLLPWQSFIVTPFIAFAGASVIIYRQEMWERFHIPFRRKRRNPYKPGA